MKLYDFGMSILIALALYSVLSEAVATKQCDYFIEPYGATVRYSDDCGLTDEQAVDNFKAEKL